MEIYQLTSLLEDLSRIGGRMGTEYTTINYTKPFSSLDKAQEYADNEYFAHRGQKIEWTKINKNIWSSGDLLYVMYEIRKIKIDEVKILK